MLPEPGHINPALPLARDLRDRGHEVIFASILDLKDHIESRGFSCIALHQHIAPRGILAAIEQSPWDHLGRPRAIGLGTRIFEDIVHGTVVDRIDELDPSIVLADVVAPHMALVAHRLGIPAARLSTSLSQRLDELPPITTAVSAGASPGVIEAAHARACCLAGKQGPQIVRLIERAVGRFGYPFEHVSFKTTFLPAFTLHPELVLASSPIDLPRRSAEQPTFLACTADLDRVDAVSAELDAFFEEGKPLIYASLGTQAFRYEHAQRFFDAVLGALRSRPSWRAVLVTGNDRKAQFAEVPENVLLLPRAPQLWALRKASVFITHGGLGGLREAIAARVPMIVVPQGYDQLGNATRVVHHGLGMRIPAPLVSAVGLSRRIDEVLEDRAAYAARLEAMDRACRDEERRRLAASIIEDIAASAPRRRRHTGRRPPEATSVADATGWLFVNARGEAAHGRGITLQAGEALESRASSRPALGVSGYVISDRLGDALTWAGGTVLGRVQVGGDVHRIGALFIGRRLHCAWLLDIAVVLCDFVRWCAERFLEPDSASQPEAVDACLAAIDEQQQLADGGASLAELEAARRILHERILAYSERGASIIWAATTPCPAEAARHCRIALIHELAMRSAGSAAGTDEGADLYEASASAAQAMLDDELSRRVERLAKESSLRVDAFS